MKIKDVPNEDMVLSPKEKAEKTIFIIISLVGMILSVFFSVSTVIQYKTEFRFITFYEFSFPSDFIAWAIRLLFVFQFFLCVLLFLRYKKTKTNKKKRPNRTKSIVLVVLWALSWLALPINNLFTVFIPPVYSQTDNPENYLQLDRYVGDDSSIYQLFPERIPSSAVSEDSNEYPPDKFPETTKYYYRYDDKIDQRYDIVAEWQLSEDEYLEEKGRILTNEDIKLKTQRGNWNCLYFQYTEESTMDSSYYYLIFAYNDNTNTVRYISSFCIDAANGAHKPYFLSLDW